MKIVEPRCKYEVEMTEDEIKTLQKAQAILRNLRDICNNKKIEWINYREEYYEDEEVISFNDEFIDDIILFFGYLKNITSIE